MARLHPIRRVSVGVLALSLAILWNSRFALGAGQAAKPDSKITAGADEVVVDLVVRDKKGNLVPDLRPDELQITDDGRPVKIKDLRLGSAGEAEGQQGTNQAHPVRLVSFVFEHLGNDAGRLAREAADSMLKANTPAEVYFAVLAVDSRLRLLQPYVTDRAQVRKAVGAATQGGRTHSNFDVEAAENTLLSAGHSAEGRQGLLSGDGSAGATGPGASFAPMMIKTLQESERIARDQQSRPSLAGLLALAQQQSAFPGRKAIVYFCEGLPLTAGTKEALRAVAAAANRANVAIYTVDVSGLSMEARTEAGREMLSAAAQAGRDVTARSPNPNVASSGRGAPAGITAGGPATPFDPATNHLRAMDRAFDAIVSDSQASLIDLARSTGGFYIGESNDLRKPARKLIEDIATYYEASYSPEASTYDGRFHPISVKVTRPSTTVQARNGYMAIPPGLPPDTQPFEASLLKNLAATELPRDLNFRAEVVPFGRTGGEVSASLVVEIPLRQMEARDDSNAGIFELHPAVVALLKNQGGEVLRKFSQDLPYRGALEAKERITDGVYTLQRSFALPPGTFVLEVAVADSLCGRMGAQKRRITIPDVPLGVEVSGISLVRRVEPLPETAPPGELFRYRNMKVIPDLQRSVSREQAQPACAFFVIYPDGSVKETPRLELELSRGGRSLGRYPMDLPADAKGPIPFVASLPPVSLPAGEYELAAIVEQGGKQVRQTANFWVTGKEPPPVSAANPEPDASPAAAAPAEGNDVPLAPLQISRIENVARPQPAEQNRILETARAHAVEYESSLPNFVCIQMTRRWRARGQGKWQARDHITEMLRYLDGKEVRRVLEVNGVKAPGEHGDLRGMLSSGEFGGLLRSVFGEDVKAAFEWKELANLRGQTCHVYSYRVEAKNSSYAVGVTLYGGDKRMVAFHGLVYIDAARYVVRRISAETDELPVSFPVQQSSIWVNYDVVQIGEHEHMLPVSAEVMARMGRRSTVKNEIVFRDYRRFGAESSIQFGSE